MSMYGEIAAGLSLWIDVVARAVNAPLASVKPVRLIEIVEEEAGVFSIRLVRKSTSGGGDLAPRRMDVADGELSRSLPPEWSAAVRGSVVELVLLPSRFVFRPLEMPSRAAEFLNGIIRAQIDRLTPWNAAEAVFSWTRPRVAGERIELTVVATGRAGAISLTQAFSELGAAGVEISTAPSGKDKVTVYSQRAGGQTGFSRLRLALVAGLAVTGLLAASSIGVGGFVADAYDTQHQQLQRRIAERRAIMQGSQTGSGSSPLELLMRRKQTTRSSVLVIETLCALLPEHTYATEVRMEGEKLQIVGVTRDAPSLIQILEQSPHFSSAGFFAPTTRSAGEQGERFHIEARLKPHFGFGT
ncbi:MAG: PilN domain-containing protein [Pseudomonadota bacterium]